MLSQLTYHSLGCALSRALCLCYALSAFLSGSCWADSVDSLSGIARQLTHRRSLNLSLSAAIDATVSVVAQSGQHLSFCCEHSKNADADVAIVAYREDIKPAFYVFFSCLFQRLPLSRSVKQFTSGCRLNPSTPPNCYIVLLCVYMCV